MMDNLVVLKDWLQKQTNNEQENSVFLLEFSKICRLCLKESMNMYGIRNHLVEFEDGSLFLKNVIEILIDEENECDLDLPQNICLKCSEMVLKYYEFKIRCKKAREALISYNKAMTSDMKNEHTSQIELNQNQAMDFHEFDNSSDDHPELCQGSDKPDEHNNVIKIELYDEMSENNHNIDRGKLPVKCEHCSESFTKMDLTKHMKTTHKDKTLVCGVCNQSFTQIQTLKRHSKIHQSDQRNKLCPFCGKCFVRTDDLRRHVRIHTNERPYACDKCDKKYKQTSELKEHMKSHSNLKSYMCNICGKTLATRNGIYVHMKVHNGIKNHACQTCGTKYVTAGQLASHIKHIHSKQKPFSCTYENCLKSFVTNIALRAHIRSHCVEKKVKIHKRNHEKY